MPEDSDKEDEEDDEDDGGGGGGRGQKGKGYKVKSHQVKIEKVQGKVKGQIKIERSLGESLTVKHKKQKIILLDKKTIYEFKNTCFSSNSRELHLAPGSTWKQQSRKSFTASSSLESGWQRGRCPSAPTQT